MDIDKIGEIFLHHRKARKLSRKKAAEMAGVSLRTLATVEGAEDYVSLKTYHNLCLFYNTEIYITVPFTKKNAKFLHKKK